LLHRTVAVIAEIKGRGIAYYSVIASLLLFSQDATIIPCHKPIHPRKFNASLFSTKIISLNSKTIRKYFLLAKFTYLHKVKSLEIIDIVI
jgi:hypothetical protein